MIYNPYNYQIKFKYFFISLGFWGFGVYLANPKIKLIEKDGMKLNKGGNPWTNK